jgi:hypothetical protein
MNIAEAKQVLIACRPGTDDLRSSEAMAALELVQREPELQVWWEQQQEFHRRAKQSFREIPVPAHLRDRILTSAKIVKVSWWQSRVLWSAAAAAVILIAGLLATQQPSREETFETFRFVVVRTVLRQYRMDIVTNNMAPIRQFLTMHDAPSDYVLPPALKQLPPMGAGVLGWRDRKVSMVCLDAAEKGPLFLFVVDRSSVAKAPDRHEFAQVSELNTISWTEGGRAYVLAGSANKEWLEKIP